MAIGDFMKPALESIGLEGIHTAFVVMHDANNLYRIGVQIPKLMSNVISGEEGSYSIFKLSSACIKNKVMPTPFSQTIQPSNFIWVRRMDAYREASYIGQSIYNSGYDDGTPERTRRPATHASTITVNNYYTTNISTQIDGGDGGGSAPASLSGSGNAQQIWNFLKGKGLSDGGTAGVMGNLQQESGLDPNARGGGLAQWGGSRWSAMVSYASQNNLSPYSLQAQLGYLWKEISSGSEGVTPGGMSGMSASQAAQYFCNNFERPGIPMLSRRISYANGFYSQFAGSSGGSSSGGGGGGSSQTTSSSSSSSNTVGPKTNGLPALHEEVLVIFLDGDPKKGYWLPFTPTIRG
jgi:hypothetical protein